MSDADGWTLRLKDFRVFRELEWSPHGVCLIAGPNGSGKTTLLQALEFLSLLFDRGHESALARVKPAFLRRVGAPEDAPVHLELEVGPVRWSLALPVDPRGLRSIYGEALVQADDVILHAGMHRDRWYLGTEPREFEDRRCCIRVFWDEERPPWMKPLVALLEAYRFHGAYWLNRVREPARPGDASSWLLETGQNLWAVLQAWKGSPRRFEDRFEWVLGVMREAFPGTIGDIEFEGVAGQPHGVVYARGAGRGDGIPAYLAADGVLTGLLHLTAVAGARRGSVIAFDELENQLHPHVIRTILQAMRERAEAEDLTIVLTTHSPVVMDEFKGHEDSFFVLDGEPVGSQPRVLDELRDADWLAHFALGDLYARLDFAAPSIPGAGA